MQNYNMSLSLFYKLCLGSGMKCYIGANDVYSISCV